MTFLSTAARRYLPLAAAVTILAIIGFLAPWGQIGELLEKIPPHIFILLFTLSLIYFVSKAFRFWYILHQLGISLPLSEVIPIYFAGQPFSFLPAGELYRTLLLEKHCKVKVSRSAPAVTIQGLVEAVILLTFSLIGAFIIGRNRIIVVGVAFMLLALIIVLRRGWLLGKHRFLNKLPFVSIQESKYRKFVKSHQQLMAPTSLTILSALSLAPVLAGIAILYVSAVGINTQLEPVEAIVSYCVPVVLSGLSFLPGGLGVGEGGTIGFLHLFGVATAASVTITLLLRAFTLAAGMVYGLIGQLYIHWRYKS